MCIRDSLNTVPLYRKYTIHNLVNTILPAVKSNQYVIVSNEKTPLFFATWTFLSQKVLGFIVLSQIVDSQVSASPDPNLVVRDCRLPDCRLPDCIGSYMYRVQPQMPLNPVV